MRSRGSITQSVHGYRWSEDSIKLPMSAAKGINRRQLKGFKYIPRTRQITSSRTKGIPRFSNMFAPVRLRVDSALRCVLFYRQHAGGCSSSQRRRCNAAYFRLGTTTSMVFTTPTRTLNTGFAFARREARFMWRSDLRLVLRQSCDLLTSSGFRIV